MIARLRRAGRWRDWSAAAALLALVLQMGMLLAQAPFGGAAASWLGMPLCHAAPAGAPAAPDQRASCPICLGIAAGGTALLPPPVAGIAVAAAVVALPSFHPALPERPAYDAASAAQPRAPPTLA